MRAITVVATGVPLVALRLLLCRFGNQAMTIERVWAAMLTMAIVVAASTVLPKHSASRANAPIVREPSFTTTVIDNHTLRLHDEAEGWVEPRTDLNGNEVDAAVGDYRIDPRDELYERHAPDTALLHLSAPEL